MLTCNNIRYYFNHKNNNVSDVAVILLDLVAINATSTVLLNICVVPVRIKMSEFLGFHQIINFDTFAIVTQGIQ